MKTFINLTNGLEILNTYEDFKFDGFIRIQSTHLEQKQYDKVISNLDSNFIMNVALGIHCHVIDYGSRRTDGKSRALRQGIEMILYFFNKRWFNQEIITKENKEQFNNFKNIKLTRCSKRKIDYFKKFIPNYVDKPNITYEYSNTNNDGNLEFYVNLIKEYKRKG